MRIKRALQNVELGAAESFCSDQGFADVQTRWWWIIEMVSSPGTTKTSRTIHPISPKPSTNLTPLWKTPSPNHIAEKTNRFFSTDPGNPTPDPSVELHAHPCGLWAHTKPSHPVLTAGSRVGSAFAKRRPMKISAQRITAAQDGWGQHSLLERI